MKKFLPYIAVALCIICCIPALIWLNSFHKKSLVSVKGQSYERAVVTHVIKDNLSEDGNRYGNQTVKVRILSGRKKGQSFTAESPSGSLFGAVCRKGRRVIVMISSSGNDTVVSVYSADRTLITGLFILAFILTVILIGGRKGIASILGLAIAFVCILYLFFPAVYRGASPVLMAVAVSVISTATTLLLLNGSSRKTWVAAAGTCAGTILSGVIALLFGLAAGISGINVPQIETLSFISIHTPIRVSELLFAGIIISSLGAVMDVGMSIASTGEELLSVNRDMSGRELFTRLMNVGKDMMGTMTNTLILAFAGGSIVELTIDYAYSLPFLYLANSFNIGIEIMQGIAGSFGVVLTVPATAAICAVVLKKTAAS